MSTRLLEGTTFRSVERYFHYIIQYQFLTQISYRRDWSKYTTAKLITELSNNQWNLNIHDVQSNWNKIEEILISTVDKLAPITEFTENVSTKSQVTPSIIKSKMRQRNRLLAKLKQTPIDSKLCNRLKVLNGKINLDWLNLSLASYKLKMKEIFLSNNWWLILKFWLKWQ